MRSVSHLKRYFKDYFNDTYLGYLGRPKNNKRKFYLEKYLTSSQPISESIHVALCCMNRFMQVAIWREETATQPGAFPFSKTGNPLSITRNEV